MTQLGDLVDIETGERKYLNREERQAFKNAIQYMKPKAKLYCSMIYYTGCRLSEALEVTPNALDYDRGLVRFRTLKQKSYKPSVYRMVELPEDYLAALESEYKAATNKGKRAGKQRIWDFTSRMACKYVTQAMERAEIKGRRATARGLRHSMGVMLALDKVPVNVIADILGHKDIKNTLIYMQILGEDRRELISNVW